MVVCAKLDKRIKLVIFDFDICDGSNVRYVQRVIPGAVVDVETGQSLEEDTDESLCGDGDEM